MEVLPILQCMVAIHLKLCAIIEKGENANVASNLRGRPIIACYEA
jgi:hypothetical protein